jgi:hypothetical protein
VEARRQWDNIFKVLKETTVSQAWWLMPVLLAAWEVETQRVVVGSQLGKKLARPHLNQLVGLLVHACHPSYAGGDKCHPGQSRQKSETLFKKQLKPMGLGV